MDKTVFFGCRFVTQFKKGFLRQYGYKSSEVIRTFESEDRLVLESNIVFKGGFHWYACFWKMQLAHLTFCLFDRDVEFDFKEPMNMEIPMLIVLDKNTKFNSKGFRTFDQIRFYYTAFLCDGEDLPKQTRLYKTASTDALKDPSWEWAPVGLQHVASGFRQGGRKGVESVLTGMSTEDEGGYVREAVPSFHWVEDGNLKGWADSSLRRMKKGGCSWVPVHHMQDARDGAMVVEYIAHTMAGVTVNAPAAMAVEFDMHGKVKAMRQHDSAVLPRSKINCNIRCAQCCCCYCYK